MKILHVIDKSFIGGGQVNVRNLLEGLKDLDKGLELHLSCRDGGPLVDWVRDLGVPVHPVPFNKKFRPGPSLALARIAREQKIDLVHAHGLVATFYCVMARLFFGLRAPVVYSQHGFHHGNYGAATIGLRKWMERWIGNRVERVIASSREDADALISGGYAEPEKVVLLHNGIPEPEATPDEVASVRNAIPFTGENPIVGIVARLHVQKGLDIFLQAAAQIRKNAPEVRFVVVGEGEIEEELHELARELDLGEVLKFTGSLPSRACHPLFDVAVLSSRWEGLPITLLEYMAMRRPMVLSAVGGCLEAVGPDSAELVPPGDPEALAVGVLRLLRSPDLAQERGEAARQRFDEAFTLPVISRQYAALYSDLVEA